MELTSSQELILWLGTAGMAAGAVIIAAIGFSLPNHERHHVTASFFVCAIAACAYLAMATGTGVWMVDDQPVYYARYIDWLVTTPLLLLGLLTVGLAPLASGGGEAGRTRNGLIGWVLGAGTVGRAVMAPIATTGYANYGIGAPALVGAAFGVLGALCISSFRRRGGAHLG